MSSALPTTLEEMQYQILQGDLSANPKLQASSIPAKDKELKTKAKKIIPAINELLKTIESCKASVETYSGQIEEQVTSVTNALGDTIKSEQLQYINQQIDAMKADMEQVVSDMGGTLRKAYAESVAEQFENLQKQIDELTNQKMAEKLDDINTMINQVIESKLAEQGAGSEETVMKRVFHSKASGLGVKCPFSMNEIIDLEKQIEVFIYSEKSSTYIKCTPTLKNDSGSIYSIYGYPYDIRVEEETNEVYVTSTLSKPVLVYFYTLE